ncbi:helix-turn-helix transcriptional regulator [Streptomyces sedi]|uniref:Response regulator transcription factor n=1 Tax=Streptomyces sedi TaxID=555059 RepID=A0A5C4USA4_9ACTN|nr:LuxR C-terminal-related transcriptional regulator [Streptomyces sedi]TNM25849.1 response regulator transcription factor [Streptomyces sedi]
MPLKHPGGLDLLALAIRVLEESAESSPWTTIAETLAECLDATAVTVTDIRQGQASPVAWAPSRMSGKLVHELSKESVQAKNPLITHYDTFPDRTPRTAEEITGLSLWRGSAAHSVARRYFGSENQMAIPCARGDDVLRSLVIYRSAPFSDGHRAFATQAQPLLAAVDGHDRVVSRFRAPQSQAILHRSRESSLTARELTVLTLLAQALPSKTIAQRLGISLRTVHKHIQNLFKKLDTHDRMETVLRARSMGLLEPATVS